MELLALLADGPDSARATIVFLVGIFQQMGEQDDGATAQGALFPLAHIFEFLGQMFDIDLLPLTRAQ